MLSTCTGDVRLPAGTIGITADSEGPPTVQWHHSFNGWELMAWELAAVCNQSHLVADITVCKGHFVLRVTLCVVSLYCGIIHLLPDNR